MKKTAIILLALLSVSFGAASQTIISSDESIEVATPKLRIAVQGGVGYRIASVGDLQSDVLEEHARKLKWGFTCGADVTYYFSETLGAGIKFNDMHSSHWADITATYNDGSQRSGRMSDVIDIMFVGPMISYRSFNIANRNSFYMNYAFGYMAYSDNAEFFDKFKLNGGTLGYMAEIGYDLAFSDYLSFGAILSLYNGTLSSYTEKDANGNRQNVKLDKDEYEGLGHLSLSLGLRYSF